MFVSVLNMLCRISVLVAVLLYLLVFRCICDCIRWCVVVVYAGVTTYLRYLSSSGLVLGRDLIRLKVMHRAH